MRRVERGAELGGGSFERGQRAQFVIEPDLPRGPSVRCGDDLSVTKREFPTFGRGRFALRARGADRLIVKLDGPFVRCVFDCACRLLAADRLQIVIDNFVD